MLHPDMRRVIAEDHIALLRRDARRPLGAARHGYRPAVDTTDIELRLCRADDDPALDRLAALAESALPAGRLVLATTRGRIVAALPLAGGPAIRDPFEHTAHLLPLLQLRAAQLRQPEPRRRLVPRYVSLIRGSTHA